MWTEFMKHPGIYSFLVCTWLILCIVSGNTVVEERRNGIGEFAKCKSDISAFANGFAMPNIMLGCGAGIFVLICWMG